MGDEPSIEVDFHRMDNGQIGICRVQVLYIGSNVEEKIILMEGNQVAYNPSFSNIECFMCYEINLTQFLQNKQK